MRTLEKTDFKKGFPQLFQFLSPSENLISQEKFLEIFLENPKNSETWVIEKDEKIVATGKILWEKKFSRGGCLCAHVEDVITHPDFQGQGLGKSVMNHLIQRAKEEKAYKIILDCSIEKEPFYQKLGFSKPSSATSMAIYF